MPKPTQTFTQSGVGGAHAIQPWTPLELSALAAWYRSDELTTSGANVLTFVDKTGNGLDFGDTASANKPQLVLDAINGHSAVEFTAASNNWLMTPVFTMTQAETVIMVLKQTAWGLNRTFLDGGTQNSMKVRQVGGSEAAAAIGIYAGSTFNTSSPSPYLTIGTWGIIKAVFNGASSTISKNNGNEATGNAGASNLAGGLILGNDGGKGASQAISMQVAEIIPVDAVLSASENTSLMAYLSARYGITVS